MAKRHEVDLRGLRCPLPIVKINKKVKEIEPGDELEAVADDPAFCLDVEAWCGKTGNALSSCESTDSGIMVVITKQAMEHE